VPIEISTEELHNHENALQNFLNLITSNDASFIAHPNTNYSPKYDDYKHIARVQI
jgi:hypothetical protein